MIPKDSNPGCLLLMALAFVGTFVLGLISIIWLGTAIAKGH